MYKVIVAFVDLQDNGHRYNAGDTFPRNGVEVPKCRIDKLSSDKNRRRMPLIEEVGKEVEVTEEVVEPEVKADEAPFMNQPEETVEPEIEKVEEKVKSTRKGRQK